MAPHCPTLLRKARHVQRTESFALQMRRHTDDSADRNHTGAADARHQYAIWFIQRGQRRLRDRREQRVGLLAHRCDLALAQSTAVYGYEARAESLHAGIVLVARGLIDRALASELGFERQHRYAIGFDSAIAAAFAHQIVDHHALRGIRIEIALAAPALFRGTGLIVDDYRAALDLAHLALHEVVVVAIIDLHARRDTGVRAVLVGLV